MRKRIRSLFTVLVLIAAMCASMLMPAVKVNAENNANITVGITEFESEGETESGKEFETESETESEEETETETVTEAETEVWFETETETESETETEEMNICVEDKSGVADSEKEDSTSDDGAETKDVKADAKTDVTITFHYLRSDNDYAGWSLWIWQDGGAGTDNAFTGTDENGAYFSMKAGSKTSKLGYIVRTPNWDKEGGSDRFVDISDVVSGTIDVYITSGVEEVREVKQDDVVTGIKIIEAAYNGEQAVEIKTTGSLDNNDVVKVYVGSGEEVAVGSVTSSGENKYVINLEQALEATKGYYVLFNGISYTITMPDIYSTTAFEEAYTYDGDDLGANWTVGKTTFKVWAPTADAVKVCLYANGTAGDGAPIEELSLEKGDKGVWSVEKNGNQAGVYYTYKVSVNNEEVEVCDPYAKAVGFNGDRAMVINLNETNPEGWEEDKNPNAGMEATDAIVYEVSVRDFSIDSSSGVSETNRGKYPAFTEHGTVNEGGQTTGIDYLKSLGVTHVQLLPIQDAASVNEANPMTSYNWGYETKNFNVPEGSFSTDPYNGAVRIKETKQMIKEMHDNGMSVVLDVVYNHVFSASDYCYNKIVPNYFTRISDEGEYSNGSLCGNDTASERSMVRNYIVDSILYWAKEYHVDGFRFDLVGVLDAETINQIVEEVKAYDSSIILYGEGWTMATVSTKDGTEFATQENAAKTPGFGYFDDRIRYRIKGNSNDGSGGYALDGSNASDIRLSVQANAGWTVNPTQIVNYISCHDDATLWDKIQMYGIANNVTRENLIKKNNLASAIIFGSQGIAFMHAGEELLRTKTDENGNIVHDSYKSPDSVNSIKWNDLSMEDIQKTVDYYKGLIAFRKAHKALRMSSAGDIRENLIQLENLPDKVVAYVIDGGTVSGETSEKILIAYNPNESEAEIELPEGEWNVCVNGESAGTEIIKTVSGKLTMTGISAYMLVQGEKNPNKHTVTVYYKTANETVTMVYGLFGTAYESGSSWSNAAMADSIYEGYKKYTIENTQDAESIQVCFTHDGVEYDNNAGNNYTIGNEGKYVIEDGVLYEGSPIIEEKVTQITVYYKTENKNQIGYGLFGEEHSQDGTWKFVDMIASSYEGYKEITFDVKNAESVQVCFHDLETDDWDSKGGQNYRLACEGKYVIEDGGVRKGTPSSVTIYYKTDNEVTDMGYKLFTDNVEFAGASMRMETSAYEGYEEAVFDMQYEGQNAEYAQVYFNDTQGNWDSNNGSNYYIAAPGVWTIEAGGVRNELPVKEEIRQITVYYKTENEETEMLYGLFGEEYSEGGSWSGRSMAASAYEGYKEVTVNIQKAESVQVCFNDKNNNWDNNGGNNYILEGEGSYVIKGGKVFEGNPETVPDDESTPQIQIDYINEKLEGFVEGAVYTVNDTIVSPVDGKIDISDRYFGTTLFIKRKGDNTNYNDSAVQKLIVPQRPEAPGAAGKNETIEGMKDGEITGISSKMEYKLSDAASWTACTEARVGELEAGAYLVRVKATSSSFASNPTTVIIEKGIEVSAITNIQKTLKDVELPAGWSWDYPEISLSPFAGLQKKSFAATCQPAEDAEPVKKAIPVTLTTIKNLTLTADSAVILKGNQINAYLSWNMLGVQADLSAYEKEAVWSSSKEKVVTVEKTKEGVRLTAVGKGTARIAAEVTVGTQKFKARYTVKVAEGNVTEIKVTSIDNFTTDTVNSSYYTGNIGNKAGKIAVSAEGTTKITVKSNNSKVVSVGKAAGKEGSYQIPITVKEAGTAKITITSNDAVKTSKDIWLCVEDKKPNLSADTITVNRLKTVGGSFFIYPGSGAEFIGEPVLAEESAALFALEKGSEEYSYILTAKEDTRKGTYKALLKIAVNGVEEPYVLPITVKVISQQPKYKLRQQSKVNLFYTADNAQATLFIESTETVTKAVLTECDFTINEQKGNYQNMIPAKEGLNTSCDKKGKLTLSFKDYREPVEVNYTVGVERKAPKLMLSNKTSVLYPNADINTAEVGITLNGAEYELSDAAIGLKNGDGYSVEKNGNKLVITRTNPNLSKEVKEKITVKKSTWTEAVELPIIFKISTKKPSVKLKNPILQLNANQEVFAYDMAETEVMWKDAATFAPLEMSVSAANNKSEKLLNDGLTFEVSGNRIIAKLNNKSAVKGSYTFKVNVKASEKCTASSALTVKVVDVTAAEAIRISQKGSIDVLNRQESYVTVTPSLKSLNGEITNVTLTGQSAHLFKAVLDTDKNKIYIYVKPSAAVITKYDYKVKLKLTVSNVEGGTTQITTNELKLKLKQSKLKITAAPKQAIFFSNSCNSVKLDITTALARKNASKPAITNMELLNYQNVFDYHNSNQELTLKSNGEAVKGKSYTLQFKLNVEGQADNEKEIIVKYKVVIK